MDTPPQNSPRDGRVWMAFVFVAVAAGFIAITTLAILSPYGALTLTDILWTLGPLTAALTCWAASRKGDAEDPTWRLLSLASLLWFCGELVWAYFRLIEQSTPSFANWIQSLYIGFPLLSIVALLQLPKPPDENKLSLRHIGNLVLITCALAMSITVALWGPATSLKRPTATITMMLTTAVSLGAFCLTALYLLWSYRWRATYWPLILICLAALIHTVTYIVHLHLRMTLSYGPGAWYNIDWMLGSGALACAAYERIWQTRHPSDPSHETMLARMRWAEAAMPTLLIVVMLVTIRLDSQWLTPGIATAATVIAIVFALALSLRDLWMQREEQKLLAALRHSNTSLTTANSELLASEDRVRSLNAELEFRVVERTRELQAAYRELESFSYAVAHDIKAPLREINSFANVLIQEHGPQLQPQALNFAQRMRTAALYLTTLVDDLLAYARVERIELKLQPLDLRSLVDSCIAEQKAELNRLGAIITVEVEPIVVRADNAALTQSVRNLLQNALKFSSRSSPPRITFSTHSTVDSVVLSITDNGIGFDMRHHDQIFGMFQRLHRNDEYPGTGIGLAITRKAIERMGGRVWAQSAVNSGAAFYFELPIAA